MPDPTDKLVTLPTAYRGAPSRDGSRELPGRGRILLALQKGGNRDQLIEILKNDNDILELEDESTLEEAFDLCIIDAPSFVKWRLPLIDVKRRAEPTLLPVMLLLPARRLSKRLSDFYEVVEELIVPPIDKRELMARIELLLRARRFSVAQQEHLAYAAHHDQETGLPNKYQFQEKLSDAVSDAGLMQKSLTIAVVHLNLQRLMKSLGAHGLARAVLEISGRFGTRNALVRHVARLETDEWGIIFERGGDLEAILAYLREFMRSLERPITVLDEKLYARARIGVATFPVDHTDARGLLDCANAALSTLKEDQIGLYSKDIQQKALQFLRTEARLREAVGKGEFELHFQPRFDLQDGACTGAEALIRWRLESGELVPPDLFIPVAEKTGLIGKVDEWVVANACAHLAEWVKAGIGSFQLSVNVTPVSIARDGFIDDLLETVERHGLSPRSLELELTETMLFDMSAENVEKLRCIRERGINIAMDDFGKGYSSLGYIHELPVSKLKIDRAFVTDLPENQNNQAITRTIIWLAKNFELSVLAEGIEQAVEGRFLRELGCQEAQGYWFARPMPHTEILPFVRDHRHKPISRILEIPESNASETG